MLKENKREEITKNIEKREALVEQVADGIWRIGVELPQNPLRELNSYLIKGKENRISARGMPGGAVCRASGTWQQPGSAGYSSDTPALGSHRTCQGGGRDGQPHLYQRNRSGNLKGRFYTRAPASAGGAIPCRWISGG